MKSKTAFTPARLTAEAESAFSAFVDRTAEMLATTDLSGFAVEGRTLTGGWDEPRYRLVRLPAHLLGHATTVSMDWVLAAFLMQESGLEPRSFNGVVRAAATALYREGRYKRGHFSRLVVERTVTTLRASNSPSFDALDIPDVFTHLKAA